MELITLALIYKFMDDLHEQSVGSDKMPRDSANTFIYYITHIENLPGILKASCGW